MNLVKVTLEKRPLYQERLRDLEALASYPLGTDRFTLSHGEDYFAFFDRLGTTHYYAMLDGNRLAAVGAGILRKVPEKAWYVCDLKVHPDYRGQHIPLKMITGAFFQNYIRCARGYGISMNSAGSKQNRVAKLAKHFKWAPTSSSTQLEIYSLDSAAIKQIAPILEKHRGPISYLSLAGKKDLILQSTGKPLPLLHAQFGPCAAGNVATPQDNHTHMFCVPSQDPLAIELSSQQVLPSSSATLIQHRMKHQNWQHILTSDI